MHFVDIWPWLVVGLLVIEFPFLLLFLRNRKEKVKEGVRRQLRQRGQQVVIPPQRGSFRGGEHRYGRVKNDGLIALTDQALYFHPWFGRPIEIPRAKITQVEDSNSFLGNARLNLRVLVITESDGNRVGFCVQGLERWKQALRSAGTD